MPDLYLDFETFSRCDIKKRGGMNYARHESTMAICLGWAFDNHAPQLWTPAEELPAVVKEHVSSGQRVYAHNATFDIRIWNLVCVPAFGWPELSLDQVVDSMALCLTYGVPASLKNAGEALGISMPKDADGNRLIKLCCTPDKNGNTPSPWGERREAFRKLYLYCTRDVDAMRQVIQKLPRHELLPLEHEIWKLTYEMNSIGLPADVQTASKIRKYVSEYTDREMERVPELCGYAFDRITQVIKMREWIASLGYHMESMDAHSVKEALDDDACPENAKVLLRMRQELGRSSTAKYKKLLEQECEGRLHDTLQYHGAGTGRWAGRGFQIHNLPRASVEDPERYVELFRQNQPVDDPVFVAKALIRPMVCAPEGQQLIVADYSSIENRVLSWLAEDWDECENFRNGVDQYKTMASARYGVAYDQVTKPQRQLGKVIILGCGFGMGKDTFKETAWGQFGVDVSIEDADAAVKAYRTKYPKIVALWNGLKLAAVKCVLTGQKQSYGMITFGLAKVNGIRWLAMRLPSGKCCYYMDPKVSQEHIPKFEHMGRVPTITHAGTNPYTKKWSRLKLIPGRITENAVQGTAREIMAQGLLNVKYKMPEVQLISTVHDEGIGLIDNFNINDDTMNTFIGHLCDVDWAKSCPVAAEGYFSKRYKKD